MICSECWAGSGCSRIQRKWACGNLMQWKRYKLRGVKGIGKDREDTLTGSNAASEEFSEAAFVCPTVSIPQNGLNPGLP
jgi:hypothetical protein